MNSNQQDSLSFRLLTALFRFLKTPWHVVSAPGLSRAETGILITIDRAAHHGRSLRVSDLSRMMRVSTPTISQQLNNLESQGFVIRSQAKDDKRVVNLTLSDKGREALRQRRSDMELNISRLAEHLGEENTEIFINLLTKTSDFYQNSENSDDESMMGFSNRRKRHHEKYHRENEEKNSMKESRQRADEDGS